MSSKAVDLRSPLSRARGLGSAKEGVHHWIAQRVTAIALLPLSLWLAFALLGLKNLDYATVSEWLRAPRAAVFMLAFIVSAYYHAYLGMQVILEDYVHEPWLKYVSLIGLRLACVVLSLASAYAVLRIAMGAGA
jgi:succinate dehydrogenase / fumarate reductase membrane anchor subunit